jgi:hypothetical protein
MCRFHVSNLYSNQLESCLEIANIQLSDDDIDVMLECIGLDDDGTVRCVYCSHEASHFTYHKSVFNFCTSPSIQQ